MCSRVANCAAVTALPAAPRALLRREVLLLALRSVASLVFSGFHQYLEVYCGELGVLSSLRRLGVCCLQLPGAIKGQLAIAMEHASAVTYPRGSGSSLGATILQPRTGPMKAASESCPLYAVKLRLQGCLWGEVAAPV